MKAHPSHHSKSSSLVTLLFLLLVASTVGACASASQQARLADGSLVASSADYHPPVRLNKDPWGNLSSIGASGVRGEFVADLVVTKDGTVQEVRLIRGMGQPYDREISNQLRSWRFKPATLNGNRVAVLYRVRYRFESR